MSTLINITLSEKEINFIIDLLIQYELAFNDAERAKMCFKLVKIFKKFL